MKGKEKLPDIMSDEDKELLAIVYSIILLYLIDEVLREVVEER